LFQAMMNIIGWTAGLTVRTLLESLDHWLAFGLLSLVAAKMIKDAVVGREEEAEKIDPTKGYTLVMLSVATSIDSLAVGLSFSVL
ncbi:MAG: manganese efflux pump, partial [Gammaproteobacteria bacterium]|nr:manganese efflux pump [Gammaproteobacteria bacterium]NIR94129.1 manganese efflux pump [Gammaproteobacteria bacterium]